MQMNIEPGQKALVTTSEWFYAPDGRQYRAVFGTVRNAKTAEATLGVKPNGKSTNWYLEIGNVTIAGCQIHYAIRCDECETGPVRDWTTKDGKLEEFDRPCAVYFADGYNAKLRG